MTTDRSYHFDGEVWEHDGTAAWHFVTLPHDVTDEIDAQSSSRRSSFGSVRVEVEIGDTTWRTSVFPDRTRGAYVLPVKRAVRDAEGLVDGSIARMRVRLVDR